MSGRTIGTARPSRRMDIPKADGKQRPLRFSTSSFKSHSLDINRSHSQLTHAHEQTFGSRRHHRTCRRSAAQAILRSKKKMTKFRVEFHFETESAEPSRVELVEAPDMASAAEEVARRMRSEEKRADVTPFTFGSSVLSGPDKLSG